MEMIFLPLAAFLWFMTFLLGDWAFSTARSLLNRALWSEDPVPPLPEAPLMFAVFWESWGPLFSAVAASLLFNSTLFAAKFPGQPLIGSLTIGILTPIPAYALLLSQVFELPYGRALALQVGGMAVIALVFLLVCVMLTGVTALLALVMLSPDHLPS